LEAHPELGGDAEYLGELQGGFRSNALLCVDDLADHLLGAADCLGERALRKLTRFEFLGEKLAQGEWRGLSSTVAFWSAW
jgi:hypothetical protein